MKLTFNTRLEQFEYEIDNLIRSSRDPQFTSYLKGLVYDARSNPADVPVIRRAVISNYDMYASRMAQMGMPVEPMFFRAIYGNMEAPEILEDAPQSGLQDNTEQASADENADNFAANESYTQAESEMTCANTESVGPAPVSSTMTGEYASESVTDNYASGNEFAGAPTYDVNAQYSGSYNNTQGQTYDQNMQMPQYNPQGYPQQAYAPQRAQASSVITSPKAEYAVGAIVMSILGSVFLLTGLVYFAVNYLNSFAQGMIMYAVCAIVLIVSEFVIRKAVPKLSAVFTAIGISGVFLTTVVNYKSLHNINVMAAAIIIALCAALVCLFGYKRQSQLYSVIGFLAAFVSSVAIGNHVTAGEFVAITIGTLGISTMWLFFPVSKRYDILTPIMMIAELTYFLATLMFKIDSPDASLVVVGRIIFTAASWFVICVIYYKSDDWNKQYSNDPQTISIINFVFFLISAFIYGLSINIMFESQHLDLDQSILYGVIIYTVIVVPQIIFAFFKLGKKSNSALAFYISALLTGALIIGCTDTEYITVPVLVFYSLLARFLAKKNENSLAFRIVDIVVQSIFAIIAMGYAGDYHDASFKMYFIGILLLIALVAGIFINTGYKTAVQIIFIFSMCFVVARVFLTGDLGDAAAMGIVLLFTYLINNIGNLKGKGFRVYNYFMLVFELLLLCTASHVDFSAEGILIFCIAAIFGLAFVILMMNREYGLFFAGYYIAIPVYLTYVSILLPIDNGFIMSIILMGIAVVSVIIGFALKEKAIRIYGLVLSILICAKIALIDFVSLGDAKYKTLMYILVGAFALAIGCIYMVLESRESKKNKPMQAFATAQNLPQSTSQYVQQDMTQNTAQYMPQDDLQSNEQYMPQDEFQNTAQYAPQDATQQDAKYAHQQTGNNSL